MGPNFSAEGNIRVVKMVPVVLGFHCTIETGFVTY